MYCRQWTTAEAGFALAEPRDRWFAPNGSTRRDGHEAASPADSVRHLLRIIASDPVAARDRQRWLARVRAVLDRAEARLRAKFEADGAVEAFLRGRTRLADGAVVGLLHLARAVVRADRTGAVAPVAVLAVGGYGRRELGPASDLDLLFLLNRAATRDHAERLIGFMLAGLWDLGFEVGHASRTVAECANVARLDHKSLSSLFDSRFLAGSQTLHGLALSDLRHAMRVGPRALAAAQGTAMPASHWSTASDQDEPDVKHGPGALRDVQRLLWLTRIDADHAASGAPGGPAAPVGQPLAAARRFLWTVRCHLHLLAGRGKDRLTRELQPVVARRLGLGGRTDSGAVELMVRYRTYTDSVRTLLAAL